jgi:predicted RNase H-like HicB family nuclease
VRISQVLWSLPVSREDAMKYQGIVKKSDDGMYVAYCPLIRSCRAEGRSATSALQGVRQALLCYVHDPEVELDVVTLLPGNGGPAQDGYTDTAHR